MLLSQDSKHHFVYESVCVWIISNYNLGEKNIILPLSRHIHHVSRVKRAFWFFSPYIALNQLRKYLKDFIDQFCVPHGEFSSRVCNKQMFNQLVNRDLNRSLEGSNKGVRNETSKTDFMAIKTTARVIHFWPQLINSTVSKSFWEAMYRRLLIWIS